MEGTTVTKRMRRVLMKPPRGRRGSKKFGQNKNEWVKGAD